ncbi:MULTISPECIES: cytochrome c biogenesis protein [unclassified Aureispira]|uniref:cytochrome c biogenesis protein n=1 Tax=unclassified Aureispira TaxID=2649989 RepID=UPI000697AD9A|nr:MULTISPECIES: cytochrome c biogenesis protein CcsA [unclassified Aureispira]WMX17352.1 cytochrome c biogenesis protein CcsA [Aureispira sp. CCB-E]
MKNIYKILGVILVSYSLLAGMLIPLGTGIINVSPRVAQGGEPLDLKIKGYNANFLKDKGNYEARIRLNPKLAICAKNITVKNNQELELSFDLPLGKLPIQTLTENGKKSSFPLLEVSGKNNGYSSLESAVYIKDSLVENTIQDFCDVVPFAQTEEEQISFPFLNILEETIRNLFYHVPMWFAMMLLMLISVVYSILYLARPEIERYDIQATSFAAVGVLFGVIGILTGALWAKHTWGAYWSFDVKQNTSAVALLIYLAYFVLRSSFDDMDKRARVAAIYNIFAFATLIPLLYIVPRMVDSLHPGMGGNPAFSKLDLDNTMRMVFYPAVLGWMMMGIWISNLGGRIERLMRIKLELEE